MKAVVLTGHGGVKNLKVTDVEPYSKPLPEGYVRVKPKVCGLTPAEMLSWKGNVEVSYMSDDAETVKIYDTGWGTPPYIVGKEVAAEVVELGPNTDPYIKVGDRVTWDAGETYDLYTGGMAEECVVNAGILTKIPEDISYADGLCGFYAMTAYYLAYETADLKPGDWAVVTLAASFIGTALTQLLVGRGVRVIGVVSNDSKAATAKSAGCEHVVVGYEHYSEKVNELIGRPLPTMERVKTLKSSNCGAAVVYEGLGGGAYKEAIRCCRVRGSIVIFGFAVYGMTENIDIQVAMGQGAVNIIPANYADHILPIERARDKFENLMCPIIRSGVYKPLIDSITPMDDIVAAYTKFEENTSLGKILISIQ